MCVQDNKGVLLLLYGLLTKCEVKMAGYWPSSFFCASMDQDRVEVRSINLQKKIKSNIPHFDRRSLVNKGYYMAFGKRVR